MNFFFFVKIYMMGVLADQTEARMKCFRKVKHITVNNTVEITLY